MTRIISVSSQEREACIDIIFVFFHLTELHDTERHIIDHIPHPVDEQQL